jgi:hypothetical protein
MSDELNLEAERAAFEAWSKRAAPAYGFDKDERGQYVAYPVHAGWEAWQAARRSAPVSAPLDTQAFPELPEPKYSADDLVDIFTAEQMFEYASKHVAPYAERIAHLERELQKIADFQEPGFRCADEEDLNEVRSIAADAIAKQVSA